MDKYMTLLKYKTIMGLYQLLVLLPHYCGVVWKRMFPVCFLSQLGLGLGLGLAKLELSRKISTKKIVTFLG